MGWVGFIDSLGSLCHDPAVIWAAQGGEGRQDRNKVTWSPFGRATGRTHLERPAARRKRDQAIVGGTIGRTPGGRSRTEDGWKKCLYKATMSPTSLVIFQTLQQSIQVTSAPYTCIRTLSICHCEYCSIASLIPKQAPATPAPSYSIDQPKP